MHMGAEMDSSRADLGNSELGAAMSQSALMFAEPQDFVEWTSLFVAGENILVPVADASR